MHSAQKTDFRTEYLTYADRFQRWAGRTYPTCPAVEIEDACQEAYMVVYQHWIEGKITSSLQAFLFAVGKNLLRDKMKRIQRGPLRLESRAEDQQLLAQLDPKLNDAYQQAHQAELVERLLAEIGEPCNQVLRLAFFADYAVESIAQAMGYESERVASARKSKCLRQLREKLSQLGLGKDDLLNS